MQEVAKALIYVSPFTITGMILGFNADTNWAAIGIGVVVGIVASALWVAFRKAVLAVGPSVKGAFREPVRPLTKPQKPKTVKWWDAEGREVVGQEQIETPRSVAVVVSEKGVVAK